MARTEAWWFAGTALAISMSGAAPAAEVDRFAAIRDFIRDGLVERSVPSIAVAVAKDGRILWEQGFGWADRERRIPASEHTAYSLASISKPLTATGLMTLVEAGRVGLDAPINGYLGDAKLSARTGDAAEATVRRVANHTAGLPLHYQFFYADEPFSPPTLDETTLRYGNLVTLPGETFQYSNLGYGILGRIIERVAGMSYAEFMRREVFVPLGMSHSSVDIGPGLEASAATRYDGGGRPLPFYTFDHPAASAVFASAHDLVRFGLFQLKSHLRDQKAILSDAAIDAMRVRTARENDHEGYGIGFFIEDQRGRAVLWHTGHMAGVSTLLWLSPRDRLAVVILSNANSSLTDEIADRVLDELLGERERAQSRKREVALPYSTPPALLGTWHGQVSTYSGNVPVLLRFLPGNSLRATFGDQPPALINEPRFRDDVLTGRVIARIGTPDTERYRYEVRLSLRLRGDVLNGAATAVGVDDARTRNALSHWIELRREKT